MRRARTMALATFAALLLGCEGADPLDEARRVCADASAEAEARMVACTTLAESATLQDADRAAALAHRGDATYEAGDVTAALRDYDAALAADSEIMAAVLGRARILIASGQLDAAEPLTARLLESGEHVAEANFLAAEIARTRGDAGAAAERLDQSLAADARFFAAYVSRGELRQASEDYVGALQDYDAALAINPQLAPALAGRCWARVLMDEGDLGAARRDAEEAASIDPRLVEGQLCRGLLQLRSEEWEAARQSYDAALVVEPGNPAALFGRGVARRRAGDDLGRGDMNQARDFEPHIARAFEDLGVRSY